MKDKGLADFALFELLAKLDHLFYHSTETYSNRKAEANRITAEIKRRFAETGI